MKSGTRIDSRFSHLEKLKTGFQGIGKVIDSMFEMPKVIDGFAGQRGQIHQNGTGDQRQSYTSTLENWSVGVMGSRGAGVGGLQSDSRVNKMVSVQSNNESGGEARAEVLRWQPLFQILNSGFSSVGRTIHLHVIDELKKADDIFKNFVGGVLAGIESIAQKLAASAIGAGILSFFGLGNFGSLFGGLLGLKGVNAGTFIPTAPNSSMATTRFSGISDEPSQERVQSLTSFGTQREPIVIQVSGNFRLGHRELIAGFKEARIIDRKLGGNL